MVAEVTDLEDPTKGKHIELEMKASDKRPRKLTFRTGEEIEELTKETDCPDKIVA